MLGSLYLGEPLNVLRDHNWFLAPLVNWFLSASYLGLIVLNCASYAVSSRLLPARKYLLSAALTVAVAGLGWFTLTWLDLATPGGLKHAIKSTSAAMDTLLVPALLCNYRPFRAWFERRR